MQGIENWVEENGNIVRKDKDGTKWVVAQVYDPKLPMGETLERRKVLRFILRACQLHGTLVAIMQSLLKAMPSVDVIQQATTVVFKATKE